MKRLLVDTGPLGKLSKPIPRADVLRWQDDLLASGWTIILPEIADYEIRRNLILENKLDSLASLDRLKRILVYQPITTATMLKAAELWADARRRGRPTADPKELDADVILAAQAIEANAIVATENQNHLSRYVTAKHWSAIAPH